MGALDMKTKKLISEILVVASVLAIVMPSITKAARKDNINIVRVRAYADGNAHIDISQPISSICGSRLRMPGSAGQENIMKIALAAIMSGNKVTIDSENAKSGNFCNVNFIWITNR